MASENNVEFALKHIDDATPTVTKATLDAMLEEKKSRLLGRLCLYNLTTQDLDGAEFVGGKVIIGDDGGEPSSDDIEVAERLEDLWDMTVGVDIKMPKWQDNCICGQRLHKYNCYWRLRDGRICGKDGYDNDDGGGILPPIGSCCVSLLWYDKAITTKCAECGIDVVKTIWKQMTVKKLCMSLCDSCREKRKARRKDEKKRKKEEEKKRIEDNKFREALKDMNRMNRPILLDRIDEVNLIDPDKARHLLSLEECIRVGNRNLHISTIESRYVNFGKYKYRDYTVGELWRKDQQYCKWLYNNREQHEPRSDGTKWYTDELDSYFAFKFDDERWVEEV